MCRVTVSILSGSVIVGRSQLLGQTVGWKGIIDKKVMEGRERKRSLLVYKQILSDPNFQLSCQCPSVVRGVSLQFGQDVSRFTREVRWVGG